MSSHAIMVMKVQMNVCEQTSPTSKNFDAKVLNTVVSRKCLVESFSVERFIKPN